MYSKYQRNKALQLYDQCNSVSKVIHQLGYPTRKRLYDWIAERDAPPKSKTKRRKFNNTPNHPRHPSLKLKLDTIHRCFVLGENVQLVSEEIGYSRASIYIWRKKYILKGAVALMNTDDDPRGNLPEEIPASSPEVEQLKRQMQEMQMEIDILKGTLDALKKDPGVDLTTLRNREKAVMIDALKDNYSLPLLLQKLKLSKSSYYYQRKRLACTDKYAELRNRIKELFNENGGRYGYRRIHALLAKEGTCVSEKIVRKLMSECGARVKVKRRNKYSSYKGEITPAVPNIIQRNFHADMPNQKWLTDITEFAIPAGKVYLSAIIDCFDGMLPAWNISSVPDASLVNSMLDRACCTLNKKEHPVIHSDRGCHYRWPGWIWRMTQSGLQRSMSKKGCSPDNSACEGFFGRLKNEMFYNRSWSKVSIAKFTAILNEYLLWYNETRIKVSLGNMSPLEYRQSLGLAS
ncbi:IS3 family transposase [Lacrimispora sp.]|uniref:IS3 family transposase n=1 Tax=Lacrimispora sp. TaxID=2719234 RepID=UPI0028AA3BC7|nr:IS3 family transposase [Lacrimispora sp.]